MAFRHDELRQGLGLLRRPRRRLSPHGLQQGAHVLRRLRHGVVELEVGKGFVPQQGRPLGAKLHRLGDDGTVVPLTGTPAARHPGLEGFLPQVAALGKRQEGLDDGA